MIVMKFGGTSVGSASRIKTVSDIVKSRLNRKPIVVVSAVTGVTDLLIKAGQEALKKNNLLDKIFFWDLDVIVLTCTKFKNSSTVCGSCNIIKFIV